MNRLGLILVMTTTIACGGSPSSPDALTSRCGQPGDVGNELGVGQFCVKIDDCAANSQATLCSSLGNDPTMPQLDSFFCTIPCSTTSPAGFCGAGATCQCAAAGCGCAPTTCAP